MQQLLLRLVQHPSLRQSACLLLWAGTSLSLQLVNRYILHFSIFQTPWFLALVSAGLALVGGRVLLYLLGSTDPLLQQGVATNAWLHVLLLGAVMGAAAGLNTAALQLLPIPSAAVVQAASPALSYAWSVLLQQQRRPHAIPALEALLVLGGVTSALWPARNNLSTAGVVLQAAATACEALWRCMHLRMLQPRCSSHARSTAAANVGLSIPGINTAGVVIQHASPLVLLANSAPAAALVLGLPTAVVDSHHMDYDKFRYRAVLPAAAVSCVLSCCLGLLQLNPGVLRAQATEPIGVLATAVRDVFLVLAATAAFNEGLSREQWVGYATAQLAGAALYWEMQSSGSSSSYGSSSDRGGDGSSSSSAVSHRQKQS